MNAGFKLDDFMAQLAQVEKLGPVGNVMGRIPGMAELTRKMGLDESDVAGQLTRMRAIRLSMTPNEREDTGLLDGDRRRRISRGAGVTVNEVSQFIRQFEMSRAMMDSVTRPAGGERLGLVLPLVTWQRVRRDPSWVHPFAWRPKNDARDVMMLVLAAAALLGCAYLLSRFAR